jgi:hypothetical protein
MPNHHSPTHLKNKRLLSSDRPLVLVSDQTLSFSQKKALDNSVNLINVSKFQQQLSQQYLFWMKEDQP